MNFTDFYNQKEDIDENTINEGFFTALAGKIGTAAMNIFRKSKHVSIAPEFLRIFKQISAEKYNKTLNKLADDFLKRTKYRKNIFIKDIRVGDIAGGRERIIELVNKYVPKIADKDNEIWQSKEHQPIITVYILSNGGKISLWCLPTDQNKPEEEFNAAKRIYAIGMDGAAEKAFMLIFGMGFKDWLVKQYVEEELPAQKQAEKEEKAKAEAEEKLSIKTIDITPEKYKSLIPTMEESVKTFVKTFFTEETQETQETQEKQTDKSQSSKPISLVKKIKELGASDPEKIPLGSQENVKKGYVYDFGKRGKIYVYINKQGKHKMAFSKGLEPLLIKYNIIAKQDETKLENVELRSF